MGKMDERLQLTLDKELKDALLECSATNEIPTNQIIRAILRDGLGLPTLINTDELKKSIKKKGK